MVVLTILEKCYGYREKYSLRSFERSLSSFVKDLKVRIKVLGKTDKNWIQVEVIGTDAMVVTNYLKQKFGLAPVFFKKIKLFSEFKGKVIDSEKAKHGLYVDVGVSFPKPVNIFLPLKLFHSQLTNGKNLSLNTILECFSLYNNFPLTIQVTRIDSTTKKVEGRLSTQQVSLFKKWISLDFDRIIVLGVNYEKINRIVKKFKVKRDIIKIIQLGFLEQLLLCKLGTDAPGIINIIGPMLPKTPLYFFSPKKIKTSLQ